MAHINRMKFKRYGMRIIVGALFLTCFPTVSSEPFYMSAPLPSPTLQADSGKIAALLAGAPRHQDGSPLSSPDQMIHFARQFIGVPYVPKTLDKNKQEQLVVNLGQLDCTTYVETVTALTLCMKQKRYRFDNFRRNLQNLRYRNGSISYVSRLHYFTDWIHDNEQMGYVREITEPDSIFSARQTLAINYMSTHVSQYPMLIGITERVDSIRAVEQALTGLTVPYIPKNEIANNESFWNTIHDGDILAIVTNKSGLDTSHIGIAVWHVDGLHLLNASQIRKKVVEEPMPLYNYMQRHPSQIGIRVIRVN